jgi:DNA (cytosine-5)-methyltransferase 1
VKFFILESYRDFGCGAGGAAMGYHRAGFEVVGVDIKPQPHYPFEFHQADALEFPLEGYDAYHASSPCQYYSRLGNPSWLKDNKYWRSVPPVIEKLKAIEPKPFVIENVENCWDMPDSFIICGFSLGLSLYRHRKFMCNFPIFIPPHQKHKKKVETVKRSIAVFKEVSRESIAGHFSGVAKARLVMGINWMSRDELSQAIPPAYTEYIGKFLMEHINSKPTVE